MGRPLDEPVKEPVYMWIQEQLLGHVPGIARYLRIQPRIEHLNGRGRDCALNLHFDGLLGFTHHFFSFCCFFF
jgi:hypothetical protein